MFKEVFALLLSRAAATLHQLPSLLHQLLPVTFEGMRTEGEGEEKRGEERRGGRGGRREERRVEDRTFAIARGTKAARASGRSRGPTSTP
jgi:hypothetical protein